MSNEEESNLGAVPQPEMNANAEQPMPRRRGRPPKRLAEQTQEAHLPQATSDTPQPSRSPEPQVEQPMEVRDAANIARETPEDNAAGAHSEHQQENGEVQQESWQARRFRYNNNYNNYNNRRFRQNQYDQNGQRNNPQAEVYLPPENPQNQQHDNNNYNRDNNNYNRDNNGYGNIYNRNQNLRTPNNRNQNYQQFNRNQRFNRNANEQNATPNENQENTLQRQQESHKPQQDFINNRRRNNKNENNLNNENKKRNKNQNNSKDNKNAKHNPKICDTREIDRITEEELQKLTPEILEKTTAINLDSIIGLDLEALNKLAEKMQISGTDTRTRLDVIFDVIRNYTADYSHIVRTEGVLQMMQGGYGFLRNSRNSYIPAYEDIFVSSQMIRRFGMHTGDTVVGLVRHPRENEDFFTLMTIESINGDAPEKNKHITPFEELTPYFPTQRLIMEKDKDELSTRVIDIVTPIGRGQRGLIVAGPRTGKTVIMQKIANSILANDKDVKLIVLLIDERPEEVTDMKRVVNAEVVSSTFDETPDRHAQVAEMVIEKAKRQVEHGHHVVILLDSITRLARAYNTLQPHSGRVLSGGVDANALHKPKRFFGAARNIEGGGSLTILATALVDTGSKMDEVIFEEFKGTGNMELHLDSKLVDRRIYPAIDITSSGTRREELLVHPDELESMWRLRRALYSHTSVEGMEVLLSHLKKHENNVAFLWAIHKQETEEEDK